MNPQEIQPKDLSNSRSQISASNVRPEGQSASTPSGPLTCPHCHERGISPLKKIFLGPTRKSNCSKCGGQWRISKWVYAVISLGALAVGAVLFGLWFSELLTPGLASSVAVGLPLYLVAIATVVFAVPVRKG